MARGTAGPAMPETVELRILPPPYDTLAADEALEWLQDDADDWLSVARFAFESDDPRTRNDAAMLQIDIGRMVGACASAMGGETIRLEREYWNCEMELPTS